MVAGAAGGEEMKERHREWRKAAAPSAPGTTIPSSDIKLEGYRNREKEERRKMLLMKRLFMPKAYDCRVRSIVSGMSGTHSSVPPILLGVGCNIYYTKNSTHESEFMYI